MIALRRLVRLPSSSSRPSRSNISTWKNKTTLNIIRSGSATVYKVPTKKQPFEALTRVEVGKKDKNQINNKTILLVGETGAGKSTLINALFNYTKGTKTEDETWFQVVEEEEGQTSDVIVYQIFGFEDKTLLFPLTIIDTPGFGSTRGFEEDVSVSRRLLDLFRSEGGVHEINAVGLVMKASDNRLSDQLMYVFDSAMSLFGKDLERNIVALITHSDGRPPKNALQALEAANIKSSKNEFNYFLFNNCQHEDRTKDRELLEEANQVSIKGSKEFMTFLERTEPQQLKTTVEVLNERIRLTACIQNLKERIKLTELKQTEIRQIKEALKRHEAEMKENENFVVEVDEPYKDKEPIRGGRWGSVFYEGAVTCSVCEETCHHPGCIVAWKPKYCKVMNWGHCAVCTKKCPEFNHVKETWRYVTKTRKVQKTLEDVKEKYEQNKAEREKESFQLENLEKETIKLTSERSKLLDEAYNCVTRLEQIALKADSGSTLVHLDFLIEKMKEGGDQEKLKKLEEMKSQVNEGTKAALRYARIVSSE